MSGTPPLRKWQKEAIDQTIATWNKEPSSKILIAACPGAGKTLFASACALSAIRTGLCDVVLVVCPTRAIKVQWKHSLSQHGIRSTDKADNESIRFRRDRNESMSGSYDAICLTYQQIAKDKELFAELARRKKMLLIADEIHHADEDKCFGTAMEEIASQASLKLALSGTPFNTEGGVLAMCNFQDITTDEGRESRRTIPLYTYSYADAIRDGCCRPVEFVKHIGKSQTTYRSLTTKENWTRIVDLARKNKTDGLKSLLDPRGDFLEDLLLAGLKSLHDFKIHDKRAAMIVVAADKDHGNAIQRLLKALCSRNPDYRNYMIQEVYNDTPSAHARIAQLESDYTDIVVTVRMISEGVDVRRLRVGVYATDWKTRMFFIQFVGRVIRQETRLSDSQIAQVIIPGHIQLLDYAVEIEKMIEEALIPENGDSPPGGSPGEPQAEFIGRTTETTGDGVIYKGNTEDDMSLGNKFLEQFPSLRGHVPIYLAAQAARDANINGAEHIKKDATAVNWRSKNRDLVSAVVRFLVDGETPKEEWFAKVNYQANRSIGIPRVDTLTDDETLRKRHGVLLSWIKQFRSGETPNVFH